MKRFVFEMWGKNRASDPFKFLNRTESEIEGIEQYRAGLLDVFNQKNLTTRKGAKILFICREIKDAQPELKPTDNGK